ncbi:MAG: hypothetical protein Q8M92_08395 [Candidatus Subteraquimicrobiales bacterium]|nr:hypothetical protein [Candidatus Subteraquimicrobiales bacterium]
MKGLEKFWKIYKALRRTMHRRELRAAQTRRAAYMAAYLTREGDQWAI